MQHFGKRWKLIEKQPDDSINYTNQVQSLKAQFSDRFSNSIKNKLKLVLIFNFHRNH